MLNCANLEYIAIPRMENWDFVCKEIGLTQERLTYIMSLFRDRTKHMNVGALPIQEGFRIIREITVGETEFYAILFVAGTMTQNLTAVKESTGNAFGE